MSDLSTWVSDQVENDVAAAQSQLGSTMWFTVDDIRTSFERLVEVGATVRYPPTEKPAAGFLASLVDPDGNVFGISQRPIDKNP